MELLEIEIKAYCNDFTSLVERIKTLGGISERELEQEDRYYNHPSRDFVKTDEALRVRSDVSGSVITYKGPKLSTVAKTRREVETGIEDLSKMGEILILLGFRESGVVRKKREVYSLGDVEICIDHVEGLGFFVELEKIASDREAVEKELFALAADLGLRKFERRSYLEMVLEKAGGGSL